MNLLSIASHHRRRYLRGHQADPAESGSTLVLALAFVTIVMALTVGLLGFSKAGTSSLQAYRVERTRRYAVDGAMQSAIQMVSKYPNMGKHTSPDPCGLRFLVQGNPRMVAPGAYLVVECAETPAAVSGVSNAGDVVGGQQTARDVTLTVTCNREPNATPTRNKVSCGSGTVSTILAKARVRYEIDYSVANQTQWAIVPKIITWEVRN